MFCPNCGKEVKDGAAFCPNCGHKMQTAGSTSGTAGPAQEHRRAPELDYEQHTEARPRERIQYRYVEPSMAESEEYKPISMWGYFGYEILFAIPIVGFVLLIVFSLTAQNRNLKNFARSYFCFLILLLVFILLLVSAGVFGGAFGAAASHMW